MMLNYDKSLMEKSIAEGWIDGFYKNGREVELICEEKGLNFTRVKFHYVTERDNE